MEISEILRYMPKEGDIIMHKDGSYHVVIEDMSKGTMSVKANWHMLGNEPSEVDLNIPKLRTSMIQGNQFLVRKTEDENIEVD
tara:strand:+ start:98 stop:346 length:249 start_codon:yes stop_codon:yes gene_type:complete